jgi:predicted GNAT superfamily acetyltransferase
MPNEILIRHCTSNAEYDACVNLERSTWGESLVVPSAIFVVAEQTGGQVLGAFDGGKLVGFTLALAGIHRGGPFLHSHMTAVDPQSQDRGIGRRLKLFQRQDALKRGIRLVEWTFDPLELKNARFNLVRLGVIARRFLPNCYGITKSPLHAGLPTDRLVAEWWLDSERVKSILADNPLPSKGVEGRISLPADLGEIKANDRAAGARIQSEIGERFRSSFAEGYVVTSIESHGTMAEYILESAAQIAGVSLPAVHMD